MAVIMLSTMLLFFGHAASNW